jgi:hypothetical protein
MTDLLAEPAALHAFTQVGAACWPPGIPGCLPDASPAVCPGVPRRRPGNGQRNA